MRRAAIKSVAVHLPERVIHNNEIEGRISVENKKIGGGVLERVLGSKTRRFAAKETQVSDLACAAARKVMSAHPDCKIDLLIFAAASSDLIEPATANIVQYKLGLSCPAMDIKNACNSVVSAMQVACAFIEAGMYKNIMIVNGEKLSEVINYNPRDEKHLVRCFPGYGLGDAGAAVLIGEGERGRIVYHRFSTWGEYWRLCTVEGGGSMAFRESDKYYFEGDARTLRNVFLNKGKDFILDCVKEAKWKMKEVHCLITHQVSSTTSVLVARSIGIDEDKCINTFGKYGNTAAATIPLALSDAINKGRLRRGDKLMILGFAAGISVSVQLIEW